MRLMTFTSALFLTAATLVVTGCGLQNAGDTAVAGPAPVTLSKMTGSIYGGRQPIGSATISLYQTGTTGYGTGATMVPGATTTSNAAGGFSLPASTCTSGTYLYITAVGGDPYLVYNPVTQTSSPSGENNTASYLIVALGPCSNAGNFGFIQMNELTTVAAVYALAPFMSDTYVASTQAGAVLIGAPTTNQTGLANAFADATTLVNNNTGAAPGANLPSGTTVPSAELNTLGDLLANCVNSASTASSPSSICTQIFSDSTPASGTTPTDVAGAMLNIAQNPGHNVSTLIADSGPGAGSPYAPYISTANDLTVAVTYTGSSISTPTAIAADASGNVWITNSPSAGAASVTKLSHTGTATNYTAGALNLPSAIAIDLSGNVWVANSGNSTLTELSSTGANVGSSPFSGGGLSLPNSVAIDGSGNVWLSNTNSVISAFNSSGTPLATNGYTPTGVASPIAVGINAH